jgi:hypothetical protein
LWTNIGRRFICMGAAGWHICFDVLDHLLSGTPIGRIAGSDGVRQAVRYRDAQLAVSEMEDKLIMKEATKRSIFRWMHIVFAIPILGYIYSPFEQIPNYAPATRFVFVPVLVLSGLWMWKGHVLRRLVSKRSANKTTGMKTGQAFEV